MGTTPLYAWPWPGYTDAADGSGAVKALAVAMDATVKQLSDFILANDTHGRDMHFAVVTRRTSTQPLPHNATTGIVMNTTEHNTWGINPRPEGWFLAGGTVSFSGNAAGFRQVVYRKNASTSNVPSSNHTARPVSTNTTRVPAQDTSLYLAPADAVDIAAWQNCGVSLNTFAAEDLCPRLILVYVHGPRPA
jgi:hypothetical protein